MQQPFVFGLNYATSNLEARQQFAFTQEQIPSVLNRLQSSGITQEAVIISTCNRTEVYCITQDIDFVINAICDIQNVCPRMLKKYYYVHHGDACVNHLFRVVSGLESMVLGETEIVAQTKEAFNLAKNNSAVGINLTAIFQMALAVEKDVRNATEINQIAISVGHAILNLIKSNFSNSDAVDGLCFIGAGDMIKQVALHFKQFQSKTKIVINRTLANAQNIAQQIGADYCQLDKLEQVVATSSIIIAACGVDKFLLDARSLAPIIKSNKQLLIIDLSLPLITDLQLKQHSNITVLTIDDIAQIVDVGKKRRQLAASKASVIIDAKVSEYKAWLTKRGLTPVIKALRTNADKIRLEALQVAQKQLECGIAADNVIHELSIKLTNKLIHTPTVNLYSSEYKLQHDLSGLIQYLYDLKI
ncbi:MAG: glutamyl-tRNA reductase [Burkholderiales bacterium]|nr:glutamyl-tRNA reductase [Burkholderiales bacterium]